MKRTIALVFGIALFPIGAPAQQKAPAPVLEILTWINSHFEFSQGNPQISYSYSLDFHGCSATLVTTENFTEGSLMMTTTQGPFNLSDLIPSQISVRPLPWSQVKLFIGTAHPIPWHSNTELPNHTELPNSAGSGTDPAPLKIVFDTQDLANRQAKAWHDAIIACGGKAVPDNLY